MWAGALFFILNKIDAFSMTGEIMSLLRNLKQNDYLIVEGQLTQVISRSKDVESVVTSAILEVSIRNYL